MVQENATGFYLKIKFDINYDQETAIKLFNERQIRAYWDDEQGKWYFSIVDVVDVLSESADPQIY